ncbi:MAG: hypothetical protein JRH20_17550, partial [Deltaproteobacteria bacterium]|nr:hypothetical protein [Deltaproteobacteria bacterium]
EQLKAHLTREAPCFPSCASSARLSLQVDKTQLTGRMEVDAAARTAVPLPGRLRQWRPDSVSVDGRPAGALFWQGGHLWVALEPGRHQIEFRGVLPAQTSVQLSLPLKPHRVEAQADGWRVDGIHESGLADDTLTLTRSERDTKKRSLQPGELPAFVRITRRVVLGLDWRLETQVDRLVPLGSPIVLAVPLLPGEMVTNERFRVREGKLQLQMAPDQTTVSWRSSLRRVPKLVLSAAENEPWSESWELAASPVWHVEATGLPRVHAESASNVLPSWRPWPGEKLTLTISRPKGVGGQSMTIDSAVLVLRPGRRATDGELKVSLRSSRGGQHTLHVPQGAQVQRVEIAGTSYPVRQDGRRVTLPISPGKVNILIKWRQPQTMGLRYVVPSISLGARSVNAQVHIKAPRSRWILLTGGTRVKPVVLFWTLLLVLLVVALGLARLPWTPLRTHQWLFLAIGLSQVPIMAAAVVAGWLLVMGWREKSPHWAGPVRFDLRQVGIGIWLLPALVILFAAIHRGLLGHPDMQIEGNGSSVHILRFFVDRVGEGFPQPWMISVPLWVYRVLMLLWALWLAWSLVGWSRWAWGAFKEGGLWQRSPPRALIPAPVQPTPQVTVSQETQATQAGEIPD